MNLEVGGKNDLTPSNGKCENPEVEAGSQRLVARYEHQKQDNEGEGGNNQLAKAATVCENEENKQVDGNRRDDRDCSPALLAAG